MTAPQAGPGLLLVESDKLLYTRPIEVRDATTFEIPVTPEWERHDIYVSALVLRGGSAASKVTPARAVGVAHIVMDRGDRKIAVEISAPQQMKPELPLPVEIKAPALAGKTAFVKGLAEGLGIDPARVASPTFTIASEYPLPDGTRLAHVDVYRLTSPAELETAGFLDLLAEARVVAVEWADRLPGALPAEHLEIRIERPPDAEEDRGETARVLHATAAGDAPRAVLARWRAALDRTPRWP